MNEITVTKVMKNIEANPKLTKLVKIKMSFSIDLTFSKFSKHSFNRNWQTKKILQMVD